MNKIKLYHFSNSDFKGYIRPSFFGLNSYSRHSKRLSGVKRSYFYLNRDSGIEYFLSGCRYLYVTSIDKSELYDLESGNITKFKDIYFTAKKLGYKGIISGNTAVLFYPIKIIKKELNN